MNRTLETPHVLRGFVLITVILLCGVLRGQEAKVRVSVEGADEVWIGQKVALVVELLAPGYFSGAPSFDLPDPEGVLLVPPVDHPVVGSETIDDTDYTVQRHELLAYPMRAGDLTIPAIGVRFAFKRAPLDTNIINATVKTQPQPLTVKMPPGAEGLGQVISAQDLTVEETWHPEPGRTNVMAGAAFTRTITFKAPDVPGMVFPPFPTDAISGLGIYAKHSLLDRSDRGSMQGERQDLITYVCQRPGQYTIPATRFIWFDLAGKQLRTNDLPARTLKVLANPAYASTAAAPQGPGRAAATRLWWGLAGLALVVALVFRTGWRARLWSAFRLLLAPFLPVRLQPLNPIETSKPETLT